MAAGTQFDDPGSFFAGATKAVHGQLQREDRRRSGAALLGCAAPAVGRP